MRGRRIRFPQTETQKPTTFTVVASHKLRLGDCKLLPRVFRWATSRYRHHLVVGFFHQFAQLSLPPDNYLPPALVAFGGHG